MTDLPTPRRTFDRLFILVPTVAMVVAAAHWPALSARAVSFDDDQYFVSNGLVRSPGWDSASRFLTEVLEPSTVNGYYQPLNMISLMLDAATGATPENLRPLHRTSLLLHIANTGLIIVLLHALFGNAVVAAAIGLLFGLHPMTVETIPWTGERKTLLATFFALCCFLSYLNYTRQPSGRSWRWYAACVLLFVLALMAKPTVTPLPVLLLLLDVWPLKRIRWKSVVEKAPLLLIAAASSVITFVSQARTASVSLPTESDALPIPFVICHNNIFYLWKMIRPVDLTSHYAVPMPFDLSTPSVLAGVIGTVVLILSLAVSLKWTRAFVVAWLFYLLGLLPTMQIVGFSNVIASDKYMYLPCLGLLMLMAAGVVEHSKRVTRVPTRVIGLAVLVGLVVLEFRGTRQYLTVWTDTETLYRYMIQREPRAPSLRSHLGNLLIDLGRMDEALAEHAVAVECSPNSPEAINDLGNALRAVGRLSEALTAYERTLTLFPNYHVAHRNLGVALAETGKLADAELHFARAIELKPINPETHDCWAMILMQQGRNDEARQHLVQALQQNPHFPDANNHMGILLASDGRASEAMDHFRRAIDAKPDYVEARYNLARAHLEQGRTVDGRLELVELLRRSPGDLEARKLLDSIPATPGASPATP
ncbi:MAG: tetratricopeptide repeat protein [Planctomycetota bacterium]